MTKKPSPRHREWRTSPMWMLILINWDGFKEKPSLLWRDGNGAYLEGKEMHWCIVRRYYRTTSFSLLLWYEEIPNETMVLMYQVSSVRSDQRWDELMRVRNKRTGGLPIVAQPPGKVKDKVCSRCRNPVQTSPSLQHPCQCHACAGLLLQADKTACIPT